MPFWRGLDEETVVVAAVASVVVSVVVSEALGRLTSLPSVKWRVGGMNRLFSVHSSPIDVGGGGGSCS